MTPPPPTLVGAWRTAADDLGLEVEAPCVVDGQWFAARVAGFGAEGGTLIDWTGSGNSHAAVDERFYVSCLNPQAYSDYERTLFQDTLNDWGWQRDREPAPDWYTGRPWTP